MPEAPSWHVYECPPMDFFSGWLSMKDYIEDKCREDFGSEDGEKRRAEIKEEVLAEYREIQDQLRRHSLWEGDIISGPYVAALPEGEYWCRVMWMLKQSNNGSTFIVSPFDLAWMRGYERLEKRDKYPPTPRFHRPHR